MTAQTGRPSCDAAAVYLGRVRGPIHVELLAAALIEERLWSSAARRPWLTLARDLREERRRDGRASRFVYDRHYVALRPPLPGDRTPGRGGSPMTRRQFVNGFLLSSRELEMRVAELLITSGFEDVVVSGGSRDGGVDVHAVWARAASPIAVAIQCKHQAIVGPAAVQGIRG